MAANLLLGEAAADAPFDWSAIAPSALPAAAAPSAHAPPVRDEPAAHGDGPVVVDARTVAELTGMPLAHIESVYDATTAERSLELFLATGGGPFARAPSGDESGDDDASVALALHLEMLETEPRPPPPPPPCDASLALAMMLQQEEEEGAAAQSNRVATQQQQTLQRREVEGEELRRHLYSASGAAAAPSCCCAPAPAPARVGGLSYACVLGAGEAAPPGTTIGGRGSIGAAAVGAAPSPAPPLAVRRVPALLIDGANVAHQHGRDGFSSRGLRLCVEYFLRRDGGPGGRLQPADLAVILNESRWDAADAHLRHLEDLGVLSWTPTGKYDDIFLLQCAADHDGCWVVTNDKWRDTRAARHATSSTRARTICFAFMGDAFSPAPDDLDRWDQRRRGAAGGGGERRR